MYFNEAEIKAVLCETSNADVLGGEDYGHGALEDAAKCAKKNSAAIMGLFKYLIKINTISLERAAEILSDAQH